MKATKETLDEIKMYQANDWELDSETPTHFVMTKHTDTFGKHLVLFIFTFWTFGIANLVYYFLAKKKRKVIK